ncbi:MAG: BtpA/SgcQ family protein [Verrucomicrobiae bacterium]|nr:BtpA/SgcQ family protein [Verrucomicrobiae bacterium]
MPDDAAQPKAGAGLDLERLCLIGVVHLPPLPGAPGWRRDMESVIERAVADARTYATAGFRAVVIENFGDTPFFKDAVPPETVAAMAAAAGAVRSALGGEFPIGFNVLRNDASAALGLCAAFGGAFIRVNVHSGTMLTDQGIIEGRAAETLRKRQSLGLSDSVVILADVMVKHASPLGEVSLALMAEDTFHRGHADALIVTGEGTGKATPLDRLRAVREAVPEAPLFAGSGVTLETLADTLSVANGVIVGSSLKRHGRLDAPVDPEIAEAFVRAAGA